MVLSQEVIKKLNPDHLTAIESILKKVVPKSTPEKRVKVPSPLKLRLIAIVIKSVNQSNGI
jgi:hypothetical protein